MRRLLPAATATALLLIAAPAAAQDVSIRSSSGSKVTTVGRSVTISGAVQGGAGRQVQLQADEHPNDAFATVATDTAGSRGAYRFRVKPNRNTRYRVVSGSARSRAITVYADHPGDRVFEVSRSRRSLVFGHWFEPPPGYDGSAVTMHLYHAYRGDRYAIKVASHRLRKSRREPGWWGYQIQLVGGGKRYSSRDPVLTCIPEPEDDGYGRWLPGDRSCGKSRFRVRRGRIVYR